MIIAAKFVESSAEQELAVVDICYLAQDPDSWVQKRGAVDRIPKHGGDKSRLDQALLRQELQYALEELRNSEGVSHS